MNRGSGAMPFDLSGAIPIVVGAVVVAALLAHAWYMHRKAEERQGMLLALAHSMRFEFFPGGLGLGRGSMLSNFVPKLDQMCDDAFVSRFLGFEPFGRGHSRRAYNLACGRRDGNDWYFFDYEYWETSQDSDGNSKETVHRCGVAAVRLPVALPALKLEPENVLHRLGAKVGMRELQVEYEDFNRRYWITTSMPKEAYDILHPQALEYLMNHPPRTWQMGGLYLLATASRPFDPHELRRVLQEMEGLIALIPAYVREDRAISAQWATPLD
jgi:hypothetical protein